MLEINILRFAKYKYIIPFLVCLFPVLALSYGKGYKLVPLFVLLLSLPVFFQTSRRYLSLGEKWFIGSFIFYFSSFVLTVLLHGDGLSKLDGPSRFLFCVPIFIAVLCYPPTFSWLSKSLIIAGFVAGVSAFVLIFVYEQGRAFTSGNDFFTKGFMPIQSGNMAMTFGVICLPIVIYYLKQSQNLIATICSFSVAFGISASYLSGSRGGWVFLPLAIVTIIYLERNFIRNSKSRLLNLSILLLPSIIVFTLLSFTPQMQSKVSRMEALTNEINRYDAGDTHSSSGIRIELWKDSIYTFIENPLFGAGDDGRTKARTERVEKGDVDLPQKYLTQHSHNQYFEALSMQGIIGFISLLGIFFAPLYLCRKTYEYASSEVKVLVQSAGLSIIMMMGYCLTQAMFRHNSGAIFYPLLTVILIGTALGIQHKSRNIDGRN